MEMTKVVAPLLFQHSHLIKQIISPEQHSKMLGRGKEKKQQHGDKELPLNWASIYVQRTP